MIQCPQFLYFLTHGTTHGITEDPVPISSATPGTHDAQDSKEETRVLQEMGEKNEKKQCTLPETNTAPENRHLEKEIPIQYISKPSFLGAILASGSVYMLAEEVNQVQSDIWIPFQIKVRAISLRIQARPTYHKYYGQEFPKDFSTFVLLEAIFQFGQRYEGGEFLGPGAPNFKVTSITCLVDFTYQPSCSQLANSPWRIGMLPPPAQWKYGHPRPRSRRVSEVPTSQLCSQSLEAPDLYLHLTLFTGQSDIPTWNLSFFNICWYENVLADTLINSQKALTLKHVISNT